MNFWLLAVLPQSLRWPLPCLLILAGHLCLVSLSVSSSASAQEHAAYVRYVRAFDVYNTAYPSENGQSGPEEIQVHLPLARSAFGGESLSVSGQIAELSLKEPAVIAAQRPFLSALVQTADMGAASFSPPSPDPSGLTFVSASNTLVMVDAEVEETINGFTHFAGANLWEITLDASVVRSANISKVAPTDVPMTNEPTGVAWDPDSGDFFFTDDGRKAVYRLKPGADGRIGTADDTWTSFDTVSVGNVDPEGITYATGLERLFVVDGINSEVYSYTPSGVLVNNFDLLRYGVSDPEAVEYNPDSGTLFVMDSHNKNRVIIELTTDGDLLRTIDISAANSTKIAGLAYAPASNGSGVMRFYIVDRGTDNNLDSMVVDGKLYEMTAPLPANCSPVGQNVSKAAGDPICTYLPDVRH